MSTANLVTQVAVALLSAGGLAFVTNLIGIRRARRLEGPQRNNIIAEGAESAVASLKAALDDANTNIAGLRSDLTAVKHERDTLADEVQDLRIQVHMLQDELHGYVHRPGGTRGRHDDRT